MNNSVNIDKRQLVEIPSTCLDYNLRKASRMAAQHYEEAMKSCGLRNTQFSLLVAASLLGQAQISDLAKALVMDRTTVSRNIKPLERDGLLMIEQGVDMRSRIIRLTESGRQRLLEALPLWQSAHESLQNKLGEGVSQQLLAALNAFSQQLKSLEKKG